MLDTDEFHWLQAKAISQRSVQEDVREAPERAPLLLGKVFLSENEAAVAEFLVDFVSKFCDLNEGVLVEMVSPICLMGPISDFVV